MSSVCAEQLQKFHTSQQKSHHLHNIDVPPRKLLSRKGTRHDDSSSSSKTAEEALFHRFLPHNSGYDDDEDDPYSSDHFRMYEFKIRRCTRSRSHDWTDCPFAHPGEKARRRDPRRIGYSGTVCPEFRRGGCARGDSCEFAHGVFECWLHPARYRTEACKDGKSCKRKVCFFAHTPRQLRVLPPTGSPEDSPVGRKGSRKSPGSSACNHCCVFCLHHQSGNCGNNNNPNSPTSTLLNFSPPLSPIKNRGSMDSVSPVSRFGESGNNISGLSYDEALAELVASLDAMNVVEDHNNQGSFSSGNNDYPWIDQSGFGAGEDEIYSPLTHHQQQQQQQTQFVLSPSTPQNHNYSYFGANRSAASFVPSYSSVCSPTATTNYSSNSGVDESPDIAWVNELLM